MRKTGYLLAVLMTVLAVACAEALPTATPEAPGILETVRALLPPAATPPSTATPEAPSVLGTVRALLPVAPTAQPTPTREANAIFTALPPLVATAVASRIAAGPTVTPVPTVTPQPTPSPQPTVTPQPFPTPIPTATATTTSIPKSESFTLTGTGDSVSEAFTLGRGLYTVTLTHAGNQNFVVRLYLLDGSDFVALVNDTGLYQGTRALVIGGSAQSLQAGEFKLSVVADGAWLVKFE